MEEYFLIEEEEFYYCRGRNVKSYMSVKNVDVMIYWVVIGFEVLMGYLYLIK